MLTLFVRLRNSSAKGNFPQNIGSAAAEQTGPLIQGVSPTALGE
jgi:hypothetical protein